MTTRTVAVAFAGPRGQRVRVRLYVREVGAGESPRLLWIHGMGSHGGVFRRWFCEHPWPGHWVALDLPGFGRSPSLPWRQRLEDYVQAVAGVCAALGWDGAAPVLVGHSFGGMVAALAAIGHPSRWGGVVLVSPAGFIPPQGALQPTPWVWLNRLGIWLTGSAWFGRRMVRFLGVDPDRLADEDRRELQDGWRRAREMARMGRFYETDDLGGQLAACGVPAVVLHGTRDPLFPFARLAAALGPGTTLIPLEGLGHLPFFQDPSGFDEQLARAIRQVTEGGPVARRNVPPSP